MTCSTSNFLSVALRVALGRITRPSARYRGGDARRTAAFRRGIDALARSGGRRRCCGSRRAVALQAAPAAGLLPLRRRPSSPHRSGSRGWADRGIAHTSNPLSRIAKQPGRLEAGLGAAATPTRATAVGLCHRPVFDLWAEPELHAPFAKVHDRTRHVVISALIKADAVAMGEAQDLSDNLSVDQVLCCDLRCHPAESRSVDGHVRQLG